MRRHRWSSALTLILLSSLCSLPAWAARGDDDRVSEVLGKMSTAMRELNYHGLFTFEYGSSLDTYRIVHRVDKGVERERLHKLNGTAQEVVRSGRQLDCLSRGDALLRGALRSWSVDSPLFDNYRFNLLAEDRIAGRPAIVVEIVPTDEFRYGYYLGLDKATGLPLKALLLDPQQTVLERFQFVDISVGEAVAATELRPSQPDHERLNSKDMPCDGEGMPTPDWNARWLPAGFEFSGQRRTADGGNMLSYSDGLATLSVFIHRHREPSFVGASRAQRGALVGFLTLRQWGQDLFSVAVVGEVPLAAAQRVVANLQPMFATGREQ